MISALVITLFAVADFVSALAVRPQSAYDKTGNEEENKEIEGDPLVKAASGVSSVKWLVNE